MNKDKQKKIEAAGHQIGNAAQVIGLPKSPRNVEIELSYSAMHLISSWFQGYELAQAQLLEFECRRILKRNWKYERILRVFKAGKIGNSDFHQMVEAATAHHKKSLKMRNRLWAAFRKKQPKKRKRKK